MKSNALRSTLSHRKSTTYPPSRDPPTTSAAHAQSSRPCPNSPSLDQSKHCALTCKNEVRTSYLYFSNYLAVRYRVTGACVVPNPAFVPSDTIRQTYL